MTVRYYLEKRKKRNNPMLHILLYVRFNGKTFKQGTRLHIHPNNWDDKKQRPKANYELYEDLNNLLDSWELEIRQVDLRARTKGVKLTVDYLKDNLSFVNKKESSFFSIWDKWITQESVIQNWTEGTVKRYQNCKNHLLEINKSYKLEFSSMNNDFLKRFIEYHQKQGYQNTFAEKNLVVVKTFLNWAVLNDHNIDQNYKKWKPNFKKPDTKENIFFLTIDELINLYNLKIKNDTLLRVRDCFCFACFTGLRHSDLQNLKKADVKNGNIEVTTIKTNKKLTISLNKYAKAILNKYKDTSGPYALPVLSNQKTNDYLKDLGQLAGLNEQVSLVRYSGNKRREEKHPKWSLLTTHVARKTFITAAVYLDIPLEVVIEITGQTLDVVKRYYQIQDKQKEREMKKFNHLKIV